MIQSSLHRFLCDRHNRNFNLTVVFKQGCSFKTKMAFEILAKFILETAKNWKNF
ncbi:hypothetical protein SAMN05444397_101890 [Flavobacterium aquidurense]|nr:hypothetical protein SAMN05444397_101890 [Flavobacterium aquidurense]